jgi:hypothetical protein
MGQHIITIKAGDTYVLKKSAKIITVATFGSATVDAPCFDLSDQEDFTCYVLKGFTSRPNHSSATINGEEQFARGIYIGDTFYPFSTSYMIDDGENDALIDELSTLSPFKDIMKDVCYVEDTDSSRGTTFYYSFLSVPSIADKMRLFVQASGVHTHGQIDLYYPFISLTHLRADDEDGTTLCGCGADDAG